jgi:hypothetical protein
MGDGGRGGDTQRGERANGEADCGKVRRCVGRSNQSAGVTRGTQSNSHVQVLANAPSGSAVGWLLRRRRASEGMTHQAVVGAEATGSRAGAAERCERDCQRCHVER